MFVYTYFLPITFDFILQKEQHILLGSRSLYIRNIHTCYVCEEIKNNKIPVRHSLNSLHWRVICAIKDAVGDFCYQQKLIALLLYKKLTRHIRWQISSLLIFIWPNTDCSNYYLIIHRLLSNQNYLIYCHL